MATILITGASRGIGCELARQYSANGDHVLASCRAPDGADALAELASNSSVTVIAMDVSRPESIAAAAAEIGNGVIDILINNAGVVGGPKQSLPDIDFEEWAETFNVNTMAPLRVAATFKDNLKKSKNPKVLTISSQLGASTWPMGGMYGYSTSKAAVNKVMQILAKDWKDDGIVVGVLHPGYVRTDMGGPGADITPEESAAGIRNVVEGLNAENSGSFYKWNGDIHPW